jgi:hypothetical protein
LGFGGWRGWNTRRIDEATLQHVSMLRILHATCGTALDAFHAANNPVDTQLVVDLEKVVERTRLELQRLAEA